MDNLFLVFFIVIGSYIWYETDTFFEYSKYLGLSFTRYKEFELERTSLGLIPLGRPLNYPEYINFRFEGFVFKILACPLCLIVWLNIFGNIIWDTNIDFLGVDIFSSWVLYFFLVWFIKKTNE